MQRAIERFGWGAGIQDTAPPIDGPLAEHARALAFWLFMQAGSQRVLDLAVQGLFQRPRDTLPEGERLLANLFVLLQRLVDHELPALTRGVRIETAHAASWMRVPQGGRVDCVASLRVSAGAPPEQWSVQRVERKIETPVNRFAAAVLYTAVTHISAVGGLYRRRGLRVPDVLVNAGVGLRRFLREHPLGTIALPPGAKPGDYWLAATRRAAELRRIRSLVQWWDEIQKVELVALHELFAAGGQSLAELSIHSVYEMMVVLGLVCALAVNLRPLAAPEPDVLRFVGFRVIVDLRFGAPGSQGGKGRGFTASLTITHEDRPPEVALIDARNCRTDYLPVYAAYLASVCRKSGCTGLLVSPGAATALDVDDPVRSIEMPADSDVPGLMHRWLTVLALDAA